MTKRRAPLSAEGALITIRDALPGGWSAMAETVARREGLVRAWGDPARREPLPLLDGILLDCACAAAGQGAPLHAYYTGRLEAAGALAAEPIALAGLGAEVARECGEAIAAIFEALSRPARSPADCQRQAREIEEAIAILTRALPLVRGDQVLAALAAGHRPTGPPGG